MSTTLAVALPSAASAALARPAPMEAATSATVTGPGNSRLRTVGQLNRDHEKNSRKKSAGRAALF